MRRRKSVGTVRRAAGVRCLFDQRPLGADAVASSSACIWGPPDKADGRQGGGALGCERDMVVKVAGRSARVEQRDKVPSPSASTKRARNGAALGI
jgi:hypothetical protein